MSVKSSPPEVPPAERVKGFLGLCFNFSIAVALSLLAPAKARQEAGVSIEV